MSSNHLEIIQITTKSCIGIPSRGRGLKVPTLELLHYNATSFRILELNESLVWNSNIGKRYACEHVLKLFGQSPDFAAHTDCKCFDILDAQTIQTKVSYLGVFGLYLISNIVLKSILIISISLSGPTPLIYHDQYFSIYISKSESQEGFKL